MPREVPKPSTSRSAKLNVRLLLVILAPILLLIVAFVLIVRHFAYPFTSETESGYLERLADEQRSSNVGPSDSKIISLPTYEKDSQDRVVYSDSDLLLRVSGISDDAPRLTVTPPKVLIGLPGVYLKRNSASGGWIVVLTSPPLNSRHNLTQLGSSSVWRSTDPSGASENGVAGQADKSKDVWQIEVPLGGPDVSVEPLTSSDVKLTQASKSSWHALLKNNKAFNDLQSEMIEKSMESLAREHVSTFTDASVDNELETLANLQIVLNLALNDSTIPEVPNESYLCRMPELRWWFGLPYSRGHTSSVRVKIDVVNGEKKRFILSPTAWHGTPDADAQAIYKLQKNAIGTFFSLAPTSSWSGERYLVASPGQDPRSLDPMIFYGILESCHSTLQRQKQQPGDSLSNLVNGLDAPMIAKLSAARSNLAKATASGDYRPTYLYCYYLMDLVELDRIATQLDPSARKSYDRRRFMTELVSSTKELTDNVTQNGYVNYKFGNPNSGFDRSFSQLALYTLVNVSERLNSYAENDLAIAISSPDKGDDVTALSDEKTYISTSLNASILNLADELHSHTGGVPYQAGPATSDNLLPGYYLAAIVLWRNQKSTEASFNLDLRHLADLFSPGSSYPTKVETYYDCYRWLYWTRVLQLLQTLEKQKHTPAGSQLSDAVTIMKNSVEANLPESILEASMGEHFEFPKGLTVDGQIPKEVKTLLYLIALETARIVYSQ